MIRSSLNRFFSSNLRLLGIGLQSKSLLNFGNASVTWVWMASGIMAPVDR